MLFVFLLKNNNKILAKHVSTQCIYNINNIMEHTQNIHGKK